MTKNHFFESSEGQLILKSLKKELDHLIQVKEKIFSKNPVEAEKAMEEFKGFFEKSKLFIEKMDDQTFNLFMRMKNYFNDPGNFKGDQLTFKDELVESFKNVITPSIPKIQKEKKGSFLSKLKSQKKWKRS